MSAEEFLIEASSVGCRTMADGTLRISFDVEPRFAASAFALFGAPGSPSVLGRLKTASEQEPAAPAARKQAAPRERMAPLCEWAVLRCAEPAFQQWCRDLWESGCDALQALDDAERDMNDEGFSKAVLLALCGLDPINGSRKDLDTNPAAAKRFHERVRAPYAAWLARQGVVA